MAKVFMAFVFLLNCWVLKSIAGPVEVEQSSKDDLSTSETYGFGYYQPSIYSRPLVATGVPLANTGTISAPLPTTIGSAAGSYARSGYGYGSGYKYGSGYDYGKGWGYGGGNAVNQFYRHHPVYVAWG